MKTPESGLRVDGCGDAGTPSKRDKDPLARFVVGAPPLAARLVEPPLDIKALAYKIVAQVGDILENGQSEGLSAEYIVELTLTEWLPAGRLVDLSPPDPMGLPQCCCGHVAGNHRWGSGSCWGATGKVPCDCVRYVPARVDPSPLVEPKVYTRSEKHLEACAYCGEEAATFYSFDPCVEPDMCRACYLEARKADAARVDPSPLPPQEPPA